MTMRYCKDCQFYECCMRTPLGGCQDFDNVAPRVDTPVTPKDAWKHLYEQLDWNLEKFRREAAKDILCAIISATTEADTRDVTTACVSEAIELADELIKQLKETE